MGQGRRWVVQGRRDQPSPVQADWWTDRLSIMATARQERRQLGPTRLAPGTALAQPAALAQPTVFAQPAALAHPAALVLAAAAALGLVQPLVTAPVQASPGPVQASALAQAGPPGPGLGQVMDNGIVPRNGPSCPLVVPSQVSFLQPKRLRPEEVKAKNAAGCLSPADAIYGADGCPLKLCPNPQWQGL